MHVNYILINSPGFLNLNKSEQTDCFPSKHRLLPLNKFNFLKIDASFSQDFARLINSQRNLSSSNEHLVLIELNFSRTGVVNPANFTHTSLSLRVLVQGSINI